MTWRVGVSEGGRMLGHHRLDARIGAGGMGEVWRAHDLRLGRDVAIKLLASAGVEGSQAVARFELEARAVAALSHPNVLAVYDVGEVDGERYIATELLEGETLADRLKAGRLPVVLALDVALQVARGLAAAHERGIVHRDLKPANIFLTRQGHVKILDFGLAQLQAPVVSFGEETISTDRPAGTTPGTVLGTVGYMAPEQVRGQPVDHRADLFSFGVVLFEMLTGTRPFAAASPIETMVAVLNVEPADLSSFGLTVAPSVDRLVRRALQKSPEARFQTASDLVFAIEAISQRQSESEPSRPEVTAPAGPRRRDWRLAVATAALVLAAFAGAAMLRVFSRRAPEITVQQTTYRRGSIGAARFSPDGHTVVLSARWNGGEPEVDIVREGDRDAVRLPDVSGEVTSVTGAEIYLLTDTHGADGRLRGDLVRIPFSGGPARSLTEDVYAADYSGGEDSAVVTKMGAVEYPSGHVIVNHGRPIDARLSPNKQWVAWLDSARLYSVCFVEIQSSHESCVDLKRNVTGIAWHSPSGHLWTSADDENGSTSLFDVEPKGGKLRLVRRAEGRQILHDLASDGRALVEVARTHRESFATAPGFASPVDLGWLTWTVVADLSDDGRTVLINDWPSVYLRSIDGTPPVRITDGWAFDLSSDGQWALVRENGARSGLMAVPTGSGSPRLLLGEPFVVTVGAWFHDQDRRVAMVARRGDEPEGLWDLAVEGGEPVLLSKGKVVTFYGQKPISPDETRWADGENVFRFDAVGEPQPIAGIQPGEAIARWGADSRGLWLFRRDSIPATVTYLDLETGQRTPSGQLEVLDAVGVRGVNPVAFSPDGTTRVWSYDRTYSDLYLVGGLE